MMTCRSRCTLVFLLPLLTTSAGAAIEAEQGEPTAQPPASAAPPAQAVHAEPGPAESPGPVAIPLAGQTPLPAQAATPGQAQVPEQPPHSGQPPLSGPGAVQQQGPVPAEPQASEPAVSTVEAQPVPPADALADAAVDPTTEVQETTDPGSGESSPVAGETSAVVVQPGISIPLAAPAGLQTLVDERRDQLRARREAMFDAMRARHGYMTPWPGGYGRSMSAYRDAMRQLHRRQRDHSRMRHDARMDAMSPWSKPQRDWSRMRSYQSQMRQLDRQEARDAWLLRRPLPLSGAAPW